MGTWLSTPCAQQGPHARRVVTAQGRELGSPLSPGSGLSALPQAWWSGSWSRTAARKPPSGVQGTAGQLEGGCLQPGRGQQQALLGSRPPGLGRGGQRLCPVVRCAGWAEDRWAGQTLGSSPWGLGRLQPVSHCSWLGSDLSWEAASLKPLCVLGQSCVPGAEIHACCPCILGQERGLGAVLTSRSSGTHLSRSEVRASL